MADELTELLDIAMDREIVSQAFYIAGQKKTRDPGAIELMKELAAEEQKHYEWIKHFRDTGLKAAEWSLEKLPDLMLSEYLIETTISADAGIQDVLTAAMKREQHSIEFYAKMDQVMQNDSGHQLCRKLIGAETNHKAKLEDIYETLFLKEN